MNFKALPFRIARDESKRMLHLVRAAWPGHYPVLTIVVAAMVYAIHQIMRLPLSPILEPDSETYLTFHPVRTAGYPLFLKLFGAETAIILQPCLYAGALAFLGIMAWRSGLGFTLTLTLMILAMTHRVVNPYHAEIMTESLFMSLLVTHLALLIRYCRLPDWRWAAAASVMGGLVTTVKPSGYALLPVLTLMVLMVRRALANAVWKHLAAALIPMLLVIAAERGYSRHHHGYQATSLTGIHFFAKAGMIDAPAQAATENDPWRKRLLTALEEDFAPIRQLLRQAPDSGLRTAMINDYETCLEYACMKDLRATLRKAAQLSPPEINALLLAVGLQRIAGAPLEYLGLSWMHYRMMWSEFVRYNPRYLPEYHDYIAAHRPLPFETDVPNLIPTPLDNPRDTLALQAPQSLPMLIGGWVSAFSLLGLAFAWQGRIHSPLAGIAALSGLTVQGVLVLTALVGVGIPRYIAVLWPAMMVTLLFGARWLWTLWLFPRLNNAQWRLASPAKGRDTAES